ncbi:MAG: hypothetical protein AB7O43_15800 [Hyphomicrobiaceae bacterium]
MARRSRINIDPFKHPDEADFDYDALLEAMRVCRMHVMRFKSACGGRNPAGEEAQRLIEQIGALARLTRVPNAEWRVRDGCADDTKPGYGSQVVKCT